MGRLRLLLNLLRVHTDTTPDGVFQRSVKGCRNEEIHVCPMCGKHCFGMMAPYYFLGHIYCTCRLQESHHAPLMYIRTAFYALWMPVQFPLHFVASTKSKSLWWAFAAHLLLHNRLWALDAIVDAPIGCSQIRPQGYKTGGSWCSALSLTDMMHCFRMW